MDGNVERKMSVVILEVRGLWMQQLEVVEKELSGERNVLKLDSLPPDKTLAWRWV